MLPHNQPKPHVTATTKEPSIVQKSNSNLRNLAPFGYNYTQKRSKNLTNVRASGSDDAIKLVPPRKLSLERALEWIEEDELVEVTPTNIRVRKRYLDPTMRRRMAKTKE